MTTFFRASDGRAGRMTGVTKTKILALRCITGGAILTLLGPVMLLLPELRGAAYGPLIAGPGLFAVGIYIWIRDRQG